ncbi:MAG: hypothetical protein MK066_12945 [Crocinitomicaceae bacterium]|nr:hypothetical protein [Crocinitomicaceae bacterium]
MEDLNDILDHNIKGAPSTKRPAFITVLCILTWVGAGLGLLTTLYSFFTIGTLETTYENFSSFSSENFDVAKIVKWQRFSIYANVFGNILCLIGAFLMWNLRKIGYYIYLPGQIIPLVIGTYAALSISSIPILGGLGIFGAALGAIFPIAFLIMYGLNLRHMR